jgi:hypothetical protein
MAGMNSKRECSRVSQRKAMAALSPEARLELALELSDLCRDLRAAVVKSGVGKKRLT